MREARPLPELATTAQTLLKWNVQRFHRSAAPRCSPPFHALIMEVVTMGLEAGHFARYHRLSRPWTGAVGRQELFEVAHHARLPPPAQVPE